MVKILYFKIKKLFGRRRLSCISFDPMGAWLQRNLPPQIIIWVKPIKYMIIVQYLFAPVDACLEYAVSDYP